MKTYEQEKAELWEWLKKKMEETAQIPIGPGLDGEHAEAERQETREFNRRMRELNAKYGKPVYVNGKPVYESLPIGSDGAYMRAVQEYLDDFWAVRECKDLPPPKPGH